MEQFLHILWSISDLIILFGLFYSALALVKIAMPFLKLKMVGIVLATLVVNIGAPYIATHFETPLFELVDKVGLSYYQPITIMTAIVTIVAFAINSGKFKFNGENKK